MRYFLYFSYCGTSYHGWQRQPNGISVQQVMEEAMSLLMSEKTSLTAAGRTDAGVHAKLMVAHFDTARPVPDISQLISRLNNYLPKDIAVQRIVPVADDAHARFDALSRTYEYHCTFCKDPFRQGLATRIPANLDFALMNEAAQVLLRASDFASFCKLHTDVKTTICHVTHAEWTLTAEGAVFTITADRFLRNMVRAVVGTLFEVGRHRLTVSQFEEVISRQHRTAAGQSVPADGLFLTNIVYPEHIFNKIST
ncbi:MAG: tRNA pseudouridine(38-40) synthase TruA [Paludibacteraceae bacterium]|nr:tRNA pseudouridine(38-40) synthase TruA [Paludibacteraceae bacterium]